MDDFDTAVMELMAEFGTTATYIKRVSTYDTTTSENVETTKEIPVQVILMDLTLQSNGLSTKFGTLIQAGDKEMFVRPPNKTDNGVAPLTVDPSNDSVRVKGIEYRIVSSKEVNTTGADTIIYDLYVRR